MVALFSAFLCIGGGMSCFFVYCKQNNAFVALFIFLPDAHLLTLVGEILGVSRTQVLLKMLPNKLERKILSLKKIKPVKRGLPSDLLHLYQITIKSKKFYGYHSTTT